MNEACPVFTNASTNSHLPWPDDLKSTEAGQLNAFFRWKTLKDTPQELEMALSLVSSNDLKTKFEIPGDASADVTLRRLQQFKLPPGASFRWHFGQTQGDGKSDPQGLVTVPGLKITSTPTTLRLLPGGQDGDAGR
ncbi:MAG: hypothetical protein ACKV19_15620 [Verrucomicrobiales bacterium]